VTRAPGEHSSGEHALHLLVIPLFQKRRLFQLNGQTPVEACVEDGSPGVVDEIGEDIVSLSVSSAGPEIEKSWRPSPQRQENRNGRPSSGSAFFHARRRFE